jgi:hypothetical protein
MDSYFWMLPEVEQLLGMTGMHVVRIDSCTVGTPYQQPMLWATTNAELEGGANKCFHPEPHVEEVSKDKLRQSCPLPELIAEKITNSWIRTAQGSAKVLEATRAVARYLLGHVFEDEEASMFGEELRAAGAYMVSQVRGGRVSVCSLEALEKLKDRPMTPGTPGGNPIEVFKPLTGGRNQYDREAIRQLQLADPEYGSVMLALAANQELAKAGSTCDDAAIYKELKKKLNEKGSVGKKAEQAVRQMSHFNVENGMLYREVLDPRDNAYCQRLVVPEGGLRSFHFNGRRYRLTLKRSILLLYHDSETIGGHPGAKDTLAKIAESFWWPGLEHDVKRWVATCSTCRMIKPTPALTTEQRMELHDRPFRVLFIDTVGPIRPQDGPYRYIAHAECPFSRFT